VLGATSSVVAFDSFVDVGASTALDSCSVLPSSGTKSLKASMSSFLDTKTAKG
jgi:hypothetical protein